MIKPDIYTKNRASIDHLCRRKTTAVNKNRSGTKKSHTKRYKT